MLALVVVARGPTAVNTWVWAAARRDSEGAEAPNADRRTVAFEGSPPGRPGEETRRLLASGIMVHGYEMKLDLGPHVCSPYDVIRDKYTFLDGERYGDRREYEMMMGWASGFGHFRDRGDYYGATVPLLGDQFLECAGYAAPGQLLPSVACRVNRWTSLLRPWTFWCEHVGQILPPVDPPCDSDEPPCR